MKRGVMIFLFMAWSTANAQPMAYVVNNLAETLSRINLESGQVQNHIVTLGETPNDIDLNNGYIYVLNSISANIQKIDPATFQIVSDIPLPVGSNPYAAVFDNTEAYVSGLVSGKVYRVNLSSGQVSGEITIGGSPEGMAIFDGKLYIARSGFNPVDFSYGQGKIGIVNLADFTLDRLVDVGKNPQAFVISPSDKLHVICTGNYTDISGAVYIYNPFSAVVEDSILIGGQPSSGAMSRQGIVYLGAGGWVDHGYIFAYNAFTHEIIHGPSNPILTGLGAYSIAIDSLGYLYSCDFGSDTVTKLTDYGQVVTSFGLGDGPQSIVIADTRSSEINDTEDLPEHFGTLRNYPNPFNASTLIEYEVDEQYMPVRLEIFDITGRLVGSLPTGTSGYRGSVLWDGNSFSGESLPSGPYFARMKTVDNNGNYGNPLQVLKLSLIK